jgi:site-specific DNA recombinase
MMPRSTKTPVVVERATNIRCAIYTRKSTDEGLENGFNTLDAQREAAEAYISSQRHENWGAVPTRYDDGGFTGANMDRPGLRTLLEDCRRGLIDCVVVYKVDRLRPVCPRMDRCSCQIQPSSGHT